MTTKAVLHFLLEAPRSATSSALRCVDSSRHNRTKDGRNLQVLVGDDRAIRWVYFTATSDSPPSTDHLRLVEAGREADGRPISVAQVRCEGGVHPAKWTAGEGHACVSYGGTSELSVIFRYA